MNCVSLAVEVSLSWPISISAPWKFEFCDFTNSWQYWPNYFCRHIISVVEVNRNSNRNVSVNQKTTTSNHLTTSNRKLLMLLLLLIDYYYYYYYTVVYCQFCLIILSFRRSLIFISCSATNSSKMSNWNSWRQMTPPWQCLETLWSVSGYD